MRLSGARRPVFLNLFRIRFPIGAIASIGHRLAGVALAAALPFLVAAFERSLNSEQAYRQALAAWRSPAGRLAALLLCWALAHHLLAGVRHLLMDVDIGSSLPTARKTAWIVVAGGVIAAATLLWVLRP
ncbi:succinate dehydrogenase cytochrome b556 subunit [mine drainage metagenome]|uniref:Succinate dehydrogenase cytochrome b556 subunit n=1 Tax=mine drainage metagenome TaxID=410659 RepID=A0A1J5RJV9_9ZZZZ